MKTSELIDTALDWAVSITLGHRPEKDFHSHGMTWNGWWETAAYIDTKPNEYRRVPKYSTNWSHGGPIIEREGICAYKHYEDVTTESGKEVVLDHGWAAHITQKHYWQTPRSRGFGPTPLIAAMRCYVASKLGDEVEIPEELK